MPIPKPSKDESQNDFISRCISFVKSEDSNMPNEQAAGICHTQWDRSKKAQDWITGLTLADEAEPRKEIMLFPFGEFHHPSYGKLNFDNKFFSDIIRNFEEDVLGTKPFMDKEHRMGEALAWFNTVPYIRENIGLFAKPEWTEEGKKLTSEKIYMYFSPWYEDFTDPQTKKLYKNVFRGGAATNIPFLKTMPPIIDEVIEMSERELVDIKLSEINIDTQADTGAAGDEGKSGTSGHDNNILNKEKSMNEKLIALLKKVFSLDEIKEDEIVDKLSKYFDEAEEAKKENEELKKDAEEKSEEKPDEKAAENKELADKLNATEKKLSEVSTKFNEQTRDSVISKALEEGKIIPADKEYWEKKFMSDPNGVTEIIDHLQVAVNLDETGTEGKGEEISSDDPGAQVLDKAKKLAEEKKIDLPDAVNKILDDNKDLAKAYNAKYRRTL